MMHVLINDVILNVRLPLVYAKARRGTPLSDSRGGGSSQGKISPFFSQWQIPQMVAKYTLKLLMVANEKPRWLRLSECLLSCLSRAQRMKATPLSLIFSPKITPFLRVLAETPFQSSLSDTPGTY